MQKIQKFEKNAQFKALFGNDTIGLCSSIGLLIIN